jgi:shikimate dehydrogenase
VSFVRCLASARETFAVRFIPEFLMTSSTFHLGLTGFPLEHSLSPRLHAAALRACSLDGDYTLFPVAPGDRQGLSALLDRLRAGSPRAGGLDGLNVTIPHKQAVLPLLDELTSAAQAVGAVNTIYREGGRLAGDNTDAPGFRSDLSRFLEGFEENAPSSGSPGEPSALVLGAGGAARAVVYALLSDGWSITLAARRLSQAHKLALDLSSHSHSRQIHCADLGSLFSALDFPLFSLIVNTTPVGMSPQVDASPWPDGLPFPPRAALYDLVYNPPQTCLVRQARAAGLRATGGLGMLVEQAALAFERWTGKRAPREAMVEAVE